MKNNRKKQRSIDYQTATHEELDHYGMSLLALDEAPELSKILRGHLLVERAIEALISKKLEKPNKFFNNHRITFEMKVDLADALGVLPPAYVSAAKALNGIRNSYAHREDYKLDVDDLNSLKINWESIQDQAFAVSLSKGVDEAAGIAVIFLNWKFLRLLHPSE